jgi:hypothetical protein
MRACGAATRKVRTYRLYAFGMNTPNTVSTGPFFAFDWRDYHYFAQFDEAQVDAGTELTLDICRPPRHRAVVLLPADHVRFSAVSSGDDCVPLEPPAG